MRGTALRRIFDGLLVKTENQDSLLYKRNKWGNQFEDRKGRSWKVAPQEPERPEVLVLCGWMTRN